MAFTPSNGTKIYIGPAVDDTTDTQAEYEALAGGTPGWVEVKGTTNIGEFGDSSSDITSTELNDSRVQHAKGARDAGSPAIVCNNKPDDPGQQAMYAAEADDSSTDYAFKVVYPNKKTPTGDGAARYFRAKVMSVREGVGAANNPLSVTFNLGINSTTVRVAAT
jgi:hypothetical protein